MEMTEVILQLANQLGIASTELVKIYAEPKAMIGILNLMGLIIILVGTIFVCKHVYKKVHEHENIEEDSEIILVVISAIISVVVLIALTGAINYAILSIYYPEYMAVDGLLDKFMRLE